jgi:hypothetical protein
MSIAAENLPLPRWDHNEKNCRTASATRQTVKKSYHAAATMVFKKIF